MYKRHGLRDKSPVTGKEIFTYGGDYGRYPASDYNFNCNGIIAPDLSLIHISQGMYANLVKAVKEGKVSFKHVINFNMDEYVGLQESHPESLSLIHI